MNNFTVEITVTVEAEKLMMKRFLHGEDIDALTDNIVPNVKEMCRQQNISGIVYVQTLTEKNGEFYDSDEGPFSLIQGSRIGSLT